LKVEIVGSSKREIVDIGCWQYIYIPMTDDEKKKFAPDNVDACWRIRIDE